MAEICCGIVSSEGDSPGSGGGGCETTSSRAARRRRIEIRRFKFVTGAPMSATTSANSDTSESVETKRQRMEMSTTASSSFSRECNNAFDNCDDDENGNEDYYEDDNDDEKMQEKLNEMKNDSRDIVTRKKSRGLLSFDIIPRYGIASVCGRRRDMEDAVAVHPSFFKTQNDVESELHYFAVYDGHGCSHVATKCRERLHEVVKEELEFQNKQTSLQWQSTMEKSFNRMDKEVINWNEGVVGNCRCELQTPECDAVGSTAVVAIVTNHKIIVANCGDSRAVLCRNGKAFPLSVDHKPDRPDELNRIQEAGGRVIYWDGPRVLGVLAMSRAIGEQTHTLIFSPFATSQRTLVLGGDNYLKPYVSCEPEVTITKRTSEDDCLILASDGLWDVVSNDTACGVARMCLRGKAPPSPATISPVEIDGITGDGRGEADKACSDASMLLTKLALARHSTDNVSVVVIDLKRKKKTQNAS